MITNNNNLTHASKTTPCPHCGKPDWCYSLGDLSVCKRGILPASGWVKTDKSDKDGSPYYAPISSDRKAPREKRTRFWEYPDRNGEPLVRVRRDDDGSGNKKIIQQHWDPINQNWKTGLGPVSREQIPVYRYSEVREAIANGQSIFVVEGEPCADALWQLGVPATTNIGGSGKFLSSDATDLEGASIVICPDRDKPGVKHAEAIAKYFPDALWLYAFPDSSQWENLPESGGLDIADWITDYRLGAEEILAAVVGEKRSSEKPGSEENNLKLAIKSYLAEEDTFKQVQLKSEICSGYRISKGDFDALVNALTARQTSQPTKYYTGEDFLFLESEGLEWLFPGISPARGLTLLYGMPGSGKTTLALDAIAAFLNNEEFLGEKSALSGSALIVAGDELPTYTQDKAVNRGFPINDRWGVLTDWDVSKWSVLEKRIEDLRPRFILIDSLTSIHLCDPNFDENSSKAAKTIRRLEILCQKYNLAIWLIHHSTKDGEKRGVASARGSTAITGAASTCINICSAVGSKDDEGIRTLRLDKVRGAKNRKFKIKLDLNGHWEVVREEGEQQEEIDISLSEKISTLLQLGGRLQVTEICYQLGMFGEDTKIRVTLNRLREKGLVDRRPDRKNPKSNVWYWKGGFFSGDRNNAENEAVTHLVTHPETHTVSSVQQLSVTTIKKEGGGVPPASQESTHPLPPPVTHLVTLNRQNEDSESDTATVTPCVTSAKQEAVTDVVTVTREKYSQDISDAVSALEMAILDEDKFLVDKLYENFPTEVLGEASILLGKRSPKGYEILKAWVAEKKLADKLSEIAKWEPPSALRKFLGEHPLGKILAANERLHRTEPDVARIIAVMAGKIAGVPEEKLSIEPEGQLTLDINVPCQDDGWSERGH